MEQLVVAAAVVNVGHFYFFSLLFSIFVDVYLYL